MSTRELKRGGVLARVAAGTLGLGSAAALMDVSYRQAKRLYRRYRREGAAGLKHRSAGRATNPDTAAKVREPQSCLLTLVDDATGKTLGRFGAQETIWAAVGVLRAWIERYGIPKALYTDWKNVYVRAPNQAERVTGAEPLTQFGRMCATLGIQIIPASSPQAKGRIERNHGTQQDRLVKKLRRKGITDLAAANTFLEREHWGAAGPTSPLWRLGRRLWSRGRSSRRRRRPSGGRTRRPIIPGDKASNRWGATSPTGSWWIDEERVEAAGAVDAKSARPPLLGKLQNSFPRASTGILRFVWKGTFLPS